MSQATVTSRVGPGFLNTAKVYANVVKVAFDFPAGLLKLEQYLPPVGATPGIPRIITDHDISTDTTFTLTLAAGVYTLTVSGGTLLSANEAEAARLGLAYNPHVAYLPGGKSDFDLGLLATGTPNMPGPTPVNPIVNPTPEPKPADPKPADPKPTVNPLKK
jgi:hypothetical protein